MTAWFGESWGAPCCTEDEHISLPLGTMCAGCDELILQEQQGVALPLASLHPEQCRLLYYHLDCYLRRVLPHTAECTHCRGRERNEHATYCEFRQGTGNCNCVRLEDL